MNLSIRITPIITAILFSLVGLASYHYSSKQLFAQIPTESVRINTAKNRTYPTSTLGLYDISTFDVYVDEQTIHVIAGGKASSEHQHISIRYTRSTDGGYHWHNPISLGESLPSTKAARGNDIQIAAKGNHLVALWQVKNTLPAANSIVSAYSWNSGKTWTQGLNPAANNNNQAYIDLISDHTGNFHAIWLEDLDENGYQSLRYAQSMDSGKQWGHPITLDSSTCSCCWNSLARAPNNILNILYRDMSPRDMSLIQSSNTGTTWQHTSTVGEFNWEFNGCPHTGGSLNYVKTKDTTQLHSLVWTGTEKEPGLYHLSSTNNGSSWSTPKKIGHTAIHGDIAADKNNNIIAIWNEMEAEGPSIFYAKSENGATSWLLPVRLTQASNIATHPKVVATPHGFLSMWTEKPNRQPSQLAWQILK